MGRWGLREGAEGLPANWSCFLSWWSQESEDFVKSHLGFLHHPELFLHLKVKINLSHNAGTSTRPSWGERKTLCPGRNQSGSWALGEWWARPSPLGRRFSLQGTRLLLPSRGLRGFVGGQAATQVWAWHLAGALRKPARPLTRVWEETEATFPFVSPTAGSFHLFPPGAGPGGRRGRGGVGGA